MSKGKWIPGSEQSRTSSLAWEKKTISLRIIFLYHMKVQSWGTILALQTVVKKIEEMWDYTCFCNNVIIQPWSCNVISALHRISDLSWRFYLFFFFLLCAFISLKRGSKTHTHRHTLAIKQLVWVSLFYYFFPPDLIPVTTIGFSSPNNKPESGNGDTHLVSTTHQANLKACCYLSSFISLHSSSTPLMSITLHSTSSLFFLLVSLMHIGALLLSTAQLNGAPAAARAANHVVGGNTCDWSQCAAVLWSWIC